MLLGYSECATKKIGGKTHFLYNGHSLTAWSLYLGQPESWTDVMIKTYESVLSSIHIILREGIP